VRFLRDRRSHSAVTGFIGISSSRWGLTFLVCLAVPAWPQQATEQPAAPTPAVRSGASRRVTIEVVVTGKSGKPAPDLEQQDFTLLDNKQPQQIVSFKAVKGVTADSPVEVVPLLDEVNNTFIGTAHEREEVKKFLRLNGGQLAQPVSVVFLSDSGPPQRTQVATETLWQPPSIRMKTPCVLLANRRGFMARLIASSCRSAHSMRSRPLKRKNRRENCSSG
jgi:hypothetical protein